MTNKGAFRHGAAVMAGIALVGILSFAPLRSIPLLEGPQSKKELIIPAPNGLQPNKIVMEVTRSVRDWMKKNNLNQDEMTNPAEYAEKITHMVAKEKSAPAADFLRYIADLRSHPRSAVSSEDFIKISDPLCLERSVFLGTVLEELGMKSRLFVMEHERREVMQNVHVFVVSNIGGKQMILDPTEDITAEGFGKYRKAFNQKTPELSDCKISFYEVPAYSEKYAKYLVNIKAEQGLDSEFKGIRKQMD